MIMIITIMHISSTILRKRCEYPSNFKDYHSLINIEIPRLTFFTIKIT